MEDMVNDKDKPGLHSERKSATTEIQIPGTNRYGNSRTEHRRDDCVMTRKCQTYKKKSAAKEFFGLLPDWKIDTQKFKDDTPRRKGKSPDVAGINHIFLSHTS